MYQRASKQARQQEGLLVADTLYQQALKLGDKKAQCLAYIIPLQFYISQKDDSKIEKASTDLKEIHVPITICNIIITLGAAKSSTS